MSRPALSISGGTPVGMPDYKPINKMKESEIKALLRPPRPALYQVWVDAVGKGLIAVGPKCEHGVASALCGAIRTQIGLGHERTWRSASVVPVSLS